MAKYIEREAALKICEKEYQERIRMSDWCGDTVAWNIGHEIKAIPTADVAPVRHGRWIPVDEMGDAFDCSECDAMVSKRLNYCPNCGAKMDAEAQK